MRTKDLIVISVIFLCAVGVTAEIVRFQLTGSHLFQGSVTAVTTRSTATCAQSPVPLRLATTDIQLRAASEYEQACNSAFIDDMMLFTNMPISTPNAQGAANVMTRRLGEFAQQKISPIVIVEPDSDWGLIDFHEFAEGDYDAWIRAYFQQLKDNGVTVAMLGLWIPFPEPQQESWNNSTPDDFAHSVNRYFAVMRSIFPDAKTGILLDSQVGIGDNEQQLLAYTRLIDNSLVDVAGLQGFPWYPTVEGDARVPVVSASEFAPAYLLDEVAKSLGTKEVLVNTGTFRHRKIENGGDVAITTSDRANGLQSIVSEVRNLRALGYQVTVNVFAENKLNNKEGVDWSYWESGKYVDSKHTTLFTNFIHDLVLQKSSISIFDSRER